MHRSARRAVNSEIVLGDGKSILLWGKARETSTLKFLWSFFILLFWIGSWFPTAPDRSAIFLAVFCILGVMGAHLAPKPRSGGIRLPKTFAAFIFALLVIGGLLALMTWAESGSANAAIMFFFVLGFIGYLVMILAVFLPNQSFLGYSGSGGMLLFLLALWSWTSAIGMYAHRGADKNIGETCILASNQNEYDTKLSSIWQMRLPEFASPKSSGGYIWEYHAILVAKIDGQTKHYNWSKKWMRFEPLDPKRNPYLPPSCP